MSEIRDDYEKARTAVANAALVDVRATMARNLDLFAIAAATLAVATELRRANDLAGWRRPRV